jgi:hypothetical protein
MNEETKPLSAEKLIDSLIRNETKWPEIFGMTESEVIEIKQALREYSLAKNSQSYFDWVGMYKGIHHETTFEQDWRNWLACVRWMKRKHLTTSQTQGSESELKGLREENEMLRDQFDEIKEQWEDSLKIQSSVPEKIYLQADTDEGIEKTWCENRINLNDVYYIRVDKYSELVAAVRERDARIKELESSSSAGEENPVEQFRNQLLQIIYENQAAMKRAKEKKMPVKEVFETESIFDAVIETYEDLFSIITNLPLKYPEGSEKVFDNLNAQSSNQAAGEGEGQGSGERMAIKKNRTGVLYRW